MSCFSFNNSIFVKKYWSHETQRTISLSNDITLNISIVIFAGPYKSTISLKYLSYHIIDKSVFIINSFLLIVFLIVFLINLLENIFESTIILFENCVLGRKFKWISSIKSVFETGSSKGTDRFISVVHSHNWTTSILEMVALLFKRAFLSSIIRDEFHDEFSRFSDDIVSGNILISISMTTNDDWVSPSWY